MGVRGTLKTIYAETETDILVPFHDVDMMMVAWHGHYVKYFEVARCELLDTIQYGYNDMVQSGFAWPVIDLAVRYVKPVRFGQWISVHSAIVEYENRLKIDYIIRDKTTGEKLTKGHTVQVAVRVDNHEMQFESPAILVQRLGLSQQ